MAFLRLWTAGRPRRRSRAKLVTFRYCRGCTTLPGKGRRDAVAIPVICRRSPPPTSGGKRGGLAVGQEVCRPVTRGERNGRTSRHPEVAAKSVQVGDVVGQVLDVVVGQRVRDARHVAGVVGAPLGLEVLQLLVRRPSLKSLSSM